MGCWVHISVPEGDVSLLSELLSMIPAYKYSQEANHSEETSAQILKVIINSSLQLLYDL